MVSDISIVGTEVLRTPMRPTWWPWAAEEVGIASSLGFLEEISKLQGREFQGGPRTPPRLRGSRVQLVYGDLWVVR